MKPNPERATNGLIQRCDMDATIERWKYDALLVAAAPDLLEAAKIAVNYMENENCDRYALDPLRAAIAKATNQ
jgi:hypothetical protein